MDDVFGSDPTELPDFVAEEESAPEAPPADLALEQPLPADPIEAGAQPAAQPLEEQPTAKSWAGKYQSAEELEKGYRELRDLQRRTAERAKATEDRASALERRGRELEEALRTALPYVQQMAQYQQQQQMDPYAEQQQPSFDPRMIGPMVDQALKQRMGQYEQQWSQQAEVQQERAEAEAAMAGFFERHPEVEPRSDQDSDIANTILALNEAWDDIDGGTVDLSDGDALEIAYEASQRPALRQVLEINPGYFDTDAGMTLARRLASELESTGQAPLPAGTTPTTRLQPQARTPVIERGSSSQTPPEGPVDEFTEAVRELRKHAKRDGSVFFE